MGSSSSTLSNTPNPEYDVFLSFRGEDTRSSITSHLRKALTGNEIRTFMDDRELTRGDEISSSLVEAIKRSRISVVIFSKDYASSKWCLNELVKILECKKMYNQMVIPVFYHVDPSHVRKQLGTYKIAFVKHEKDLKKMPAKVQSWRSALTEASNLAGWDLSTIRSEAVLVDEVVKDVLKKLNRSCSSDCKGLVGLDSRIDKIKSLLFSDLSDFQVVGIWGMGGIGKTTLAGAVFNQFYSDFKGHHFCNVREESERLGLYHLRNEILSRFLGEENLKIGTPTIPAWIRERLQGKKILIVLDDVNSLEELEFLAGGLDRLGLGSKIIITARDKNVLRSYGVQHVYEVEKFNVNEALQLFCNYAFKQNQPPQDLVELSIEIVTYAQGNPLAIKVLGSSLYEKSKNDWESAMCNLKTIVSLRIFDVLKISYERLSQQEKNIFLDIACFFGREHINLVTKILDGWYNQSTSFCLTTLAEKSLISISKYGEMEMHNLLQELGRDIDLQESKERPGQRTRLWYHENVCQVLRHNEGSDSIKGILLDMSKIEEIQLSSQAFTKMPYLILLKFFNYMYPEDNVDISKVRLPLGLEYLPDKLRYLHWDGYPFEALPPKFSPENLVVLNLCDSNVKQLWEGKMNLPNLESLDLSESRYLTRIPDLSDAVKLKELTLDGCSALVDVSLLVKGSGPDKLKYLWLSDCESLRSFSSNIHFKSLEQLSLEGCYNLTKFPQISGNIYKLEISPFAIEEFRLSLECFTNLNTFMPFKIPEFSMWGLEYWEVGGYSSCSILETLPEILEEMKSFKSLSLEGATKLEELLSSIENLSGLQSLVLRNCKHYKFYPKTEIILSFRSSDDVFGWLKFTNLIENVVDMFLEFLSASRIVVGRLPHSIAHWRKITTLNLAYCKLTVFPEDLVCVSSLKRLYLSGHSFESLPITIKQLSRLESLHLSNCDVLQSLPELPLSLKELDASDCKQLRSLPKLPSNLEEEETSKLEIMSSCRGRSTSNNIKFWFKNCHKLDENASNIWANANLRFQHMANGFTSYEEKVYENYTSLDINPPAISFFLPGSEILDWINYKSPGSSLNIGLPQHWYNERFIGFALCVVGFEENFKFSDLYGHCNYSFKTSHGDVVDFRCTLIGDFFPPLTWINSDHVLLTYDPCFDARLSKGDYTNASFQFQYCLSLDGRTSIHNYKIKKCGVCPLYAKPNNTQSNGAQPNISVDKLVNQACGETVDHVDASGSESERFDEEEGEELLDFGRFFI